MTSSPDDRGSTPEKEDRTRPTRLGAPRPTPNPTTLVQAGDSELLSVRPTLCHPSRRQSAVGSPGFTKRAPKHDNGVNGCLSPRGEVDNPVSPASRNAKLSRLSTAFTSTTDRPGALSPNPLSSPFRCERRATPKQPHPAESSTAAHLQLDGVLHSSAVSSPMDFTRPQSSPAESKGSDVQLFPCSPVSQRGGSCSSRGGSSSRVSFRDHALVLGDSPEEDSQDEALVGSCSSLARISISAARLNSQDSSEFFCVSLAGSASLASSVCEEMGLQQSSAAVMVPLVDATAHSGGRRGGGHQAARRKKRTKSGAMGLLHGVRIARTNSLTNEHHQQGCSKQPTTTQTAAPHQLSIGSPTSPSCPPVGGDVMSTTSS